MGVDIIEPEPLLVHGLEEDRVFHFSRESHCGFGKHRSFSHSILLYYYYYILDSSYRKRKKKVYTWAENVQYYIETISMKSYVIFI
jgi:hypothetical protein